MKIADKKLNFKSGYEILSGIVIETNMKTILGTTLEFNYEVIYVIVRKVTYGAFNWSNSESTLIQNYPTCFASLSPIKKGGDFSPPLLSF